jgi:hypothetical protein
MSEFWDMYISEQTYDHLPTAEDSAEFEKEGLRIQKK